MSNRQKLLTFLCFVKSAQHEERWRILKSLFCGRTVEIVFKVNARLAFHEIFEMTDGGQFLVIASQVFGQRFSFHGRFDDDE